MEKIIFMFPRKIRRIVAKITKSVRIINVLSQDTDFYVIKNLAKNSATPSSYLEYFITDRKKYFSITEENILKEAVASNFNINETTCRILVNDDREYVKEVLSRNIKVLEWPEIQEKLSNDPDRYVRHNIAYHTNIEKIIEKLSHDDEWFVQLGVACNKNISVKKQYELSKSTKFMVIVGLLENLIVDPDILDDFSNSTDIFIKEIVAGHINTKLETLERLRYDESRSLRKIAKYNLKKKKKILKHFYKTIQ